LAPELGQLIHEGFLERIDNGLNLLDSHARIRVVSHYDADGICSAGIICLTLLRKGLDFHATPSRNLDEDLVRKLNEEGNELVIISDMGSGQLDQVERIKSKVIVIDHHAPLRDSEKIVQINPHLFGIDGTRGACASTTSLLFALRAREENWDLSALALAGCIADRQHVGGFEGLNEKIFKELQERKLIRVERQLALKNMKLKDAIATSINPYFAGLSGREEEVERMISDLKIDRNLEVRELGVKEKKSLTSYLSLKLLRQGCRPETIQNLVENKFWLEKEGMYADEFSSYVNSCGRLGYEGIGLSICLGDRDSLEEAKRLREEYLKEMMQGLLKLEREGVFEKKHLQFFYADNPTLAGAWAEIGMQYLFDQEKATVALSVMEKKTKVSARATRFLVSRGLDLAMAFRESALALEGAGGGHNIASGATIPKGKEDKFLEAVDKILEKQLTS